MIANFLRFPRTAAEIVADSLRIIGLLSVVFAALWLSPTDAGILALTLPALVAPRFIGARPAFDIVFSALVLVAAWSNIADVYRTLASWDIVMHFLCTAALAPMLYLLLAQFDVVPAPGISGVRPRVAIVLSTMIGLAISALWEMVEWTGFVAFTDEIHVEYEDTIGDMAMGGLGAFFAGIVLARVRLMRAPSPSSS